MDFAKLGTQLPLIFLRGSCAYALVALLFVSLQDHLVLPVARWPWQQADPVPRHLPRGVSTFTLDGRDAEAVRMLRFERRRPGNKALIFFQGNGMLLRNAIPALGWFAELGYNAYAMDYRGAGYSVGAASEDALKLDAVALYDLVEKLEASSPTKPVLFGQSFGSGLATYLSTQRACAKLILISPYTSLQDIAAQNVLFRTLLPFMRWNLPQRDFAADSRCPAALIVHSERDAVIEFKLAAALAKKFGPATNVQFIADPEASHNTVWERRQVEIANFLRQPALAE